MCGQGEFCADKETCAGKGECAGKASDKSICGQRSMCEARLERKKKKFAHAAPVVAEDFRKMGQRATVVEVKMTNDNLFRKTK